MRLSERQMIFTKNVACLIQYAEILGIGLTFGEAYRTPSQIVLNFYGYIVYYAGGKVRLNKSRKLSHTLLSLHGDRLAVDFNFFIDGKLTYKKADVEELGDYWESLHPDNRWGGYFENLVDTPHFQMAR